MSFRRRFRDTALRCFGTCSEAVSMCFEALEDFAARLEEAVGRLAAWAHGHHCGTCRHEQA
ncbi:MAG: hypothetical protein ACRDZ4_15695 [Egibacteraceae bacterium]